MLHFQIDFNQLSREPAGLKSVLEQLETICERQLAELMLHPTHRELMSRRIKRGIQAAKARRQQDKQTPT